MRFLFVAALFCAVASMAWAYSPVPVAKSAAETTLSAALEHAPSDSAKLKIAEDALNAHPEDVPAARMAQDVITKLMPDPVAFFKARAEKSDAISAHYLYGYLAGDSVITAREAAWILAKDPKSYWGHMLAADAEWNKENVNYAALTGHIADAIAVDPSRPEAYIYMGYVAEEQEKWQDARQAFEAAAVSDPSSATARDQRLTAYAQLRDGKAYFDLAQTAFPATPLTMDLPRANGKGHLTTADLLGKNTVVEYWAFT
ncbi:MAG TPA: hypothetical protein VGL38_06460 [bacterium]|jgi:tetratricopeptide (TPR) repeat protein